MTKMMKRMLNSYVKGVSKSMDANRSVKAVSAKKVTVASAWKSVGDELCASFEIYEKKHRKQLDG